MNAHDALYANLRESFENGELTDPILCRAFREAKPQAAPQLEAQLRTAEDCLRAAEDRARAAENHRLQDAQKHAEELKTLGHQLVEAIDLRERRIFELELEKPELRRVKWDTGEREQIEQRGWVKRAAD
jgi:hypothetical protein